MSWERKRLVDVADFTLGKMLDQKKNKGEPLPYLANVNVRWGSFDLDDLRQMRFEPHEAERFGLKCGDIVMCEGGEPGRCAIWKDSQPQMMIQKALHRIRPHDGLDNRFLFYTFLHKGRTGGFSPLFTGSTIKHLPREKLAKVEVDIPPLPTQKRIASILSAYDDLIENNRRRIQLLEQSARLLYKEWFVHLRFPGHEHVKIKDGVPEGWEVQCLSDIATKIGSGATPRGGAAAYQSEGITLIRSQNIYDYRFEEAGLTYINENQAEKLSLVTVESLDILLNITGASVGRCCMVPVHHIPARVNQHVMIIRMDLKQCSPQYVLYFINSYQQKQRLLSIARAGGATREALTKDVVQNISVPIPPEYLLREFDEVIGEMFMQQQLLASQNSKLSAALDLLLPRMMSGDMAV